MSAGPTKITVSEASRRLGRCPQTVRNWLGRGKLSGSQEQGNRWLVEAKSVDELLAELGRKEPDNDIAALRREVNRLASVVEELRKEGPRSASEIEALERERDRYRADAVAMRQAALSLNAASGDVHEAVSQALSVLRHQQDALAQLLGPGTPQDLIG
jgi:chromosome segregation ATPase